MLGPAACDLGLSMLALILYSCCSSLNIALHMEIIIIYASDCFMPHKFLCKFLCFNSKIEGPAWNIKSVLIYRPLYIQTLQSVALTWVGSASESFLFNTCSITLTITIYNR